jgi:hypothetical protein
MSLLGERHFDHTFLGRIGAEELCERKVAIEADAPGAGGSFGAPI